MKKRIFSFLCVVFLCLTFVLPVQAAGAPRLVDDADCLSSREEAALLNRLDNISARQGMDVVVVTVPALYGENVTAFADDFYDENGYRSDGILLLVAVYDRKWAISTTGRGIAAFTDAGQEYMADRFLDDLSDGDYYDAFTTYAELCDDFIAQAKTGRPYDVGSLPKEPFHLVSALLISFGIGLFVALLVTGVMRSKLKSVRMQAAASQYVIPGSMNITEARDMYLYRQIYRQKRETRSAGGSSTHTSSSGRSHGGSSGSF